MEENGGFGQSVPNSLEAEQAVLGSMLRDKKCIPLVIESVKPEDFHTKINHDIYKVIFGMFNISKKMDVVLIKDEVLLLGGYQSDQITNYLMHLMNVTPTAANVGEYIVIVKDRALLRKIQIISGELLELVRDGRERGDAILEQAEQKFESIRRGRTTSGLVPIARVLNEVQEKINESAMNDSNIPGLSTGLGDLDRAISGLNKSDLILLAARPGMGKTSMALNLLLHAGKFSKKEVAFFSLEMSREQLGMRLVASESFVDNKKLATGDLSEKELENITEACISLSQTTILIDEDSMITVADINAKCKRVDNLGLVIIDYLQLMSSAGKRSGAGENRQQVVSEMSRYLKIMAKELDVPVICLSQLSRASEKRENKRPMLSDLRESGAIEQDADIVMFLYRDDYYDKDSESHNIAECIIAKNRHGETGTVELEWVPQFTTFRGIERHAQEY